MTPGDSTAAHDSLATFADSAGAALADSLARAAAAPRRDYIAEVRANFTPENRAYAGTRVVLDFVEPALAIVMLAILLFSGVSARLRDIARNLGHRRYVQVLVYFALFWVLTFVISLPWAWYREFALEHQYGLSNQSFLGWLADDLKNLGFSVLVFGVIPLISLAYGALAKYPRTWWLWLAGGSVPLILLGTLLTPIVFDPAFNKFTPLSDPVLKREILDLAARAGIPGRNVYQVDKSAQTKKLNAYVSGWGASQRIVLWDTTLQTMSRDEILFVMGHEMGHYRLHHIWKGVAFYALLSVVLFFLAHRIMTWAIARFGAAWEVEGIADIATLPLFGITLTILSAIAQPATAAFSRAVEHEADVFAVEVTRDNDAGARAFLKLGAQNRNDPEPSPFVRWVLYDHPPLGERIRFALEYRPWEKGEGNRFYHPGP